MKLESITTFPNVSINTAKRPPLFVERPVMQTPALVSEQAPVLRSNRLVRFLSATWQWAKHLILRPLDWILPSRRLFKRYGLDPHQVAFVTSKDIVLSEPDRQFLHRMKNTILKRALQAHELAKKQKILGNYTKDYRGAYTMLENGTWAAATNLEINTAKFTPCAERSSLLGAVNQFLNRSSLLKLDKLPIHQLEKFANGFKVRLLVMCADNMHQYAEICPDCEGWAACQKFFSPNTLFMALGKDEQGHYSIKVQPLLQRQPRWEARYPLVLSSPDLSLDDLPSKPFISEKAQQTLQEKPWLAESFIPMVKQAKASFESNKTAEINGNNFAATVAISNGHSEPQQKVRLFTAGRFEWKWRWYESPEVTATVLGYQTLKNEGAPVPIRVEAVSYYGVDKDIPQPAHLGRIAQSSRGGPDTLVITVENDRLCVRSVQDYIPKTSISNGTPGSTTLQFAVD